MIGILDYGMGNLRSVQKAFDLLGGPRAVVVTKPDDVAGCEKVVLPGVGNFTDGMQQLHDRGFVEPVRDFIQTARPLLGICMGMQLLFDSSTEDAPEDRPVSGLGVVPGRVVRFNEDRGADQPRLKVPHMGWNKLDFTQDNPLSAGLDDDAYVYFVHGYYCVPDGPGRRRRDRGLRPAVLCRAAPRQPLGHAVPPRKIPACWPENPRKLRGVINPLRCQNPRLKTVGPHRSP